MNFQSDQEVFKRRPINLTIREDVINKAKDLNLNASKAAEYGILEAIKQEKERQWLKKNEKAIKVHNKRIEDSGALLKPIWLK